MTAHDRTFPAGGFFIAGFEGTSPSEEILALITDHDIGGVILYGRNCGTAEEVALLTRSLQTAALAAGRSSLGAALPKR